MAAGSPEQFERWRPRVIVGLAVATGLIVAYWTLWWSERSLVASRATSSYYGFEESFQLADGWLLFAVIAAAVRLRRRRASALLWLLAAGGAGLYLLGMDLYYDVRHGIYASSTGGVIELAIDVLVAAASIGVLWWSWRNRGLIAGARFVERASESVSGEP
jgi:ferric-dicitrate binding protein FerR (iron transport regulator)